MPIRVQLDRVLLERRMSLTELADRVGVTLANLSILKTGKARAVRFSTLDALCRELECQPGDLLAFEPGPAESDDAADDEMLEGEPEPAPKRRGRPPLLKARAVPD
jgi:putative transcriptional regulator